MTQLDDALRAMEEAMVAQPMPRMPIGDPGYDLRRMEEERRTIAIHQQAAVARVMAAAVHELRELRA